MAEREKRLNLFAVVVPVPHHHTLGIAQRAVFHRRVVQGRVRISKHPIKGAGQLAAGIGLAKHNRESLIALEVELSKKSPQDYSDVGAFYSNTIDVCQVIWVVRSESYKKYIRAHLQKGSSTQASEHSFVLLDHYIQSQWQAQIIDGKHQGKKLIEILKAPLQNEGKMFCANFALDVRKYPMISRSPILADKADLGLSRHY